MNLSQQQIIEQIVQILMQGYFFSVPDEIQKLSEHPIELLTKLPQYINTL